MCWVLVLVGEVEKEFHFQGSVMIVNWIAHHNLLSSVPCLQL